MPATRALVFEELADVLVTNRYVIMEGDFNLDLGRVRAGGRHDVSRWVLCELLGRFSLIDAYVKCCPGDSGVTWRNSRGNCGRLDYFFVSASVSLVLGWCRCGFQTTTA